MADSGSPNRPSRGSGSLTVHLADELDVYFNEVAHGRPVGFVASPKWKPRSDVYETDGELIVHMDIAGMQAGDFSVELDDGILKISGERIARQAILFDRAFDARQAEAAGLCDEVVPCGQMDAAIDRAIGEATEGGAVAVGAQRKALRVGAEPIDTFRRYMALYVREQALCMYSDGLITNLRTYWNAQNRAL